MNEVHRLHDDRPWGSFDQFTQNQESTVKILRVAPGKRLSLQRHAQRAEYWYVLSGNGTAEVDGTEHPLSAGTEVRIPRESTHRLSGGTEELVLLEVAFGHFDEEDIERLEDDFGRAASRTE